MPNHVRVLTVPDADRAELQRRAEDRATPARVAERARIVLLSADGLTGPQIAGHVGCSEPTVVKWRSQYAESGLAGLEDAPRGGGPVTVLTGEMVHVILAATLTPPPRSLQREGVTQWSARRLADWLRRSKKLQVSHDSVARVWRRFGLAPHRTEGFTFSTDPHLETEIRDVAGLYLAPPDNAVVLCADDSARHGVTSLIAALNVASGQVTDACDPKHRHQAFLTFLTRVAAAYPDTDLHVVLDTYATHEHPNVEEWLANNPRVTLHFTPTSCSWLNLVECFLSVITRQATRRGSFTSANELTAAIGAFIDTWNKHPTPLTWVKDADEIIAKDQRAKTKAKGRTDH